MLLKNGVLVLRSKFSRLYNNKFSTLPDDGLTLHDFIYVTETESHDIPPLQKRTADGRLRLPEWLKRDVVAGERDVCSI
jgi:hypothetical protein